jgi:hypothetical protein
MSNRYARILAAGGAAVLAAALAAAPALAAGTWTIQPGGAITATSGLFTFKDHTTGTVIACRSSPTASGTLEHGAGLPGHHAGSLSAVSIGDCYGPGGGPAFVLKPAGLPWHLNLSAYNATTGVARGTISHLAITVGKTCSFVIDGTSGTASDGQVRFTYTDSTGQLTVLGTSGNLHFWNVSSGCLGLFLTGDRATLSDTFTVSPKQAITSP